jgi:hypothetical protein
MKTPALTALFGWPNDPGTGTIESAFRPKKSAPATALTVPGLNRRLELPLPCVNYRTLAPHVATPFGCVA